MDESNHTFLLERHVKTIFEKVKTNTISLLYEDFIEKATKLEGNEKGK